MTSDERQKRGIRIAPFVVAILCFAMPFINISCKDDKGNVTVVQSFTGFKLAFGGQIVEENPITGEKQNQEVKQQAKFLIALLCALAAAGAACMEGRNGKLYPAILGVAGIIFLFLGKSDLPAGNLPADAQDAISIQPAVGFILACVCFGLGAVISGMQMQMKDEEPVAAGWQPPPPPNLPPVPPAPNP